MSSIATVVQSFKWYIFLAVLCTAFDVVAQESTVEKQYDSIAQLLSNTKNEDSIAHYIKFQKGLVENATDKKKLFAVVMKSAASATRGSRAMQAHLETGYALAKEIQDSIALNEATIRLARVFQVKNDYTKALKFANESIKISEAISNDEALIEAYATRANIYNNISQIVEAIKDLNTAKKIAFQLPDNEKMLIPLLKTKSYIQYSNNQYEAGLQTLDEIIRKVLSGETTKQ
jgi:tetratricopeptide (TPR) repeat protein